MELIFYGNGPIMANILTSIVYILTSPDYSTLLSLVMVLAGALMLGRWHMVNSEGGSGHHGLAVSVGVVALLYVGLWAPKQDLVINDPLNNNYSQAIKNVPLGFAQVVHISNKITNGFADLFDKGFSMSGFPDSMTYNNGMVPGLLTIESLGQLQPLDQFLTQNIMGYFKDCVFPAMLMNNNTGPNIDTLAKSTNLLKDIQTNLSTAWVTQYYSSSNPGGTQVSCSEMYDKVSNDITTAIQNPNGALSQAFTDQLVRGFGGAAAYANPTTSMDLLQDASKYIIGGYVDAQQLIAQATLINAFNPALQEFAARNGINPNALDNALTQNVLETTMTMNASYALAQQILPLSFAIISALVYAMLPIMFAMMFVPQLTKKYGIMALDLLMWIAFWAPLASVVNALVQASDKQTFQSFGISAISVQNWPYLIGHTYTLMAIAGDIMFSVPMLAFALASGSAYALTSVAGSVAGLSKAAAARGASTLSDIGAAQSEISQASKMGQLGMIAQANNMSPQMAAQMMVDMEAANPAGRLSAFLSTGGFNPLMKAEANNTAKATGAGLGLDNISTAFSTGMGESQSLVGKIRGMNEISKMNNMDIAKLAELTQQLSSAGALGNVYAYGGDMQLAERTAAMSTLQTIRNNQGFVNALKGLGLLSKDFNSLSAPDQIKQLAHAMPELGTTVKSISLTAAQATKIAGKPMGAGSYDLSWDKNGNLVLTNQTYGTIITGNNINTDNITRYNKSINNDSENNITRDNLTFNNITGFNKSLRNNSTDNELHHNYSVNGFSDGTLLSVAAAALKNPNSPIVKAFEQKYADMFAHDTNFRKAFTAAWNQALLQASGLTESLGVSSGGSSTYSTRTNAGASTPKISGGGGGGGAPSSSGPTKTPAGGTIYGDGYGPANGKGGGGSVAPVASGMINASAGIATNTQYTLSSNSSSSINPIQSQLAKVAANPYKNISVVMTGTANMVRLEAKATQLMNQSNQQNTMEYGPLNWFK